MNHKAVNGCFWGVELRRVFYFRPLFQEVVAWSQCLIALPLASHSRDLTSEHERHRVNRRWFFSSLPLRVDARDNGVGDERGRMCA